MRLIYIVLLLALGVSITGCSTLQQSSIDKDETIIYLVRHAEKADDGTADPPLTSIGAARAGRLASLLSSLGIDEVYSTNFKRTRSTAQPTAIAAKTDVIIYDHKAPDELATLLKAKKGKTILISGHSNSTPDMVNRLIGEPQYEKLDEKEYNMIYKVTISKDGMGSMITSYDNFKQDLIK